MMVVDTHVLLWIGENPDRLSSAAKAAVAQGVSDGAKLIVSSLSFYEIAWGIARGRIESELAVDRLLARIEARFRIRFLTADIAIAAAQLPPAFPSDPFDRMIAATAIVEGVPLITADERIRNSGAVRTIW